MSWVAGIATCNGLQLLEGDTPGKVGGPPGDAFELVYTSVTDTVREKVHAVDPVLAEYIRCRGAFPPCSHFSHSACLTRVSHEKLLPACLIASCSSLLQGCAKCGCV